MNCEYWKDIVAQLKDLNKCNWASHVLSTDLHTDSHLTKTVLGAALKCVSRNEIIKGTIYTYRDWDSQPYCDLILARFNANEILSLFLEIKSPNSNMKVGVLGILEDMDRGLAVKLASILNNPDETEDVLNAVRYSLRSV